MRPLGLLLGCFLALASVAPAAADAPLITRRTIGPLTFTDATTCPGVTATVTAEEQVTVLAFSETRVQIHVHRHATVAANGKTITDNDNFTYMFDPRTTVRQVVGTVHNVQVPGYGVLVLDAGNIVFDFAGPAPLILFEGGPHQFIREGWAAVCAYFTAP